MSRYAARDAHKLNKRAAGVANHPLKTQAKGQYDILIQKAPTKSTRGIEKIRSRHVVQIHRCRSGEHFSILIASNTARAADTLPWW